MPDNHDRRRFKRTLFSKNDQIMAFLVIPEHAPQPIVVQIMNIGEGGILFTLRSGRAVDIRDGQTVLFKEISNNDNQKCKLDVEAEVIWVLEDFAAEYTGVGARFLNINNPEIRNKIIDCIEHCK
jgi:hypothetical protein